MNNNVRRLLRKYVQNTYRDAACHYDCLYIYKDLGEFVLPVCLDATSTKDLRKFDVYPCPWYFEFQTYRVWSAGLFCDISYLVDVGGSEIEISEVADQLDHAFRTVEEYCTWDNYEHAIRVRLGDHYYAKLVRDLMHILIFRKRYEEVVELISGFRSYQPSRRYWSDWDDIHLQNAEQTAKEILLDPDRYREELMRTMQKNRSKWMDDKFLLLPQLGKNWVRVHNLAG